MISEPQVGQWTVIDHDWMVSARRIEKVTPKTVSYRWSGTSTTRVDRSRVKFWGSEQAAKRLYEQMTSSRAQLSEDEQSAHLRHKKRVAGFIEAAFANDVAVAAT